MTRQYDNYADLITFSRSSGGTALRPISYGPELVTNGTFDSDSDWVKGAGWTISGGVAVSDGTNDYIAISQPITGFDVNKVYKFSFDLVVNSGVARFFADGTAYENLTSSGTYEYIIKPTNSAFSIQIHSRFPALDGTVDNVSVKEVLFDQPDGTLTLFNHPADIPRIEYDADGNVLGLLIEESRTNLLTYSEDFDNPYWGKTNVTVTPNAAVSPDGLVTADKLIKTTTAGNSEDLRFGNIDPGGVSSFSMWAKQGEHRYLYLRNSFIQTYIVVDLEEGELVRSAANFLSANVVAAQNGWLKVTAVLGAIGPLRINISSANEVVSNYVDIPAGDGTSGIYIWGAQFEAGAFPTSYITTAGSTATRSADAASIPVADFGYNQSEGTVVVEASTNSTAATNHNDLNIISSLGFRVISSGSRVGGSAEGTYSAYSPTTAVLVNKSSVITEGTTYKAAYVLADNDVALSVNGASVVTDTSTSITSLIAATVEIGYGYGYLNGHIKSIKYYPRRLTNAQLVEITS